MYYNYVIMKKQFLAIIQLSLLLTGCNNINKEETTQELDLSDPIKVYQILKNSYNSNYVSYEKETFGSIKSSSKNIGPDYYSRFLKNNKIYYLEETYKGSSLYDVNEAIIRYEDYESSTFGNSLTDSLKEELNITKGLNYPALTYNSLDDYKKEFYNTLKDITPYIINEGYESLSFEKVNKKETNDNYIFNYELNTKNIIKNNKLNGYEKYSSLDATYSVMKNYLEYFSSLADTSIYSMLTASFTIEINKSNNEISKITRHEEFQISKLTFNADYETKFRFTNDNNYSSSILNLKDEMDQIIKDSSDKALLEIYNFYLDLNNKYKSKNYYSVTSGSANALGGMYSQTILGYKLKYDEDYFFTTITTSAFVKSAESRFHNISKELYKIGKGNDPKASGKYGSVSKWENMNDYSKDNYMSTIGHTMDDLTNFEIDENNLSKAFTKAKTYKEDDMYVYSYSVSYTDSDEFEDVAKGYKIEMNHMSNMGLPTFSKLEFNIYLDSSKENIIKITNHEEYQTGGFAITSDMTNTYYTYSSLSEVPNEITSNYKNLIK